ncbi:hypothetical protein CCP4SC76_5180025 [Gammaproteobacteria bacterium]
MPLTNSEAERALRHWVIARYFSHGTRTGQGTRAFTALASDIETCRKRSVSPGTTLPKRQATAQGFACSQAIRALRYRGG